MAKYQIIELGAEGAEIALKQAVDDSVLKDIPFVGTVVKLIGVGVSIRDNLYLEKIRRFLTSINEVSDSEKHKMRESVALKQADIERLAQKILLILESQSDIEKSEIIANFFIAYLDEVISEVDFRRSLDVVANYFLDDIFLFLREDGYTGFMRQTYESLERRGISNLVGSPLIGFDSVTSNELRNDGWVDDADATLFASTDFGGTFQKAFHHGVRQREMR